MPLPAHALRHCVLALTVAPALAVAALAEPPAPGERQVQLAPRAHEAQRSAPPERPVARAYRTMRQAAEAGVQPFQTAPAAAQARPASAPRPARAAPGRWLASAALLAAALLALAGLRIHRSRRTDEPRRNEP